MYSYKKLIVINYAFIFYIKLSVMACNYCGGKKKVECEYCRGASDEMCPACGGSNYQPCPACSLGKKPLTNIKACTCITK